MFEGCLQRGHARGKWRELSYGVGKFIKCKTVSGTHEFLNEARGGFGFEFEILYFTQARIDHQSEVQRLLRFRLEDFYLLLDAFLIDLELILREVERGAAVFVEHAGEGADQIDLGTNASALVLFGMLPRLDAHLRCGGNQQQTTSECAREGRAEHHAGPPFQHAHSKPLVWLYRGIIRNETRFLPVRKGLLMRKEFLLRPMPRH